MSDKGHEHHEKDKHGEAGHHVLPYSMGVKIFFSLLILTVITVWAARHDLGALNFPVAMLIATVKALLVVFFFMGLEYDSSENRIIFFTSFVFFGIFLLFTMTDLFSRAANFRVTGSELMEVKSAGFKHKKPWESSPEMLAFGKELFTTNCVVCHGESGKGDGPAGVALNPKPRNFTHAEEWKNGRSITKIHQTLEKGLGNMPSFAGLGLEAHLGLAQYVLSLGPDYQKDSAEDFKKIGIDITKEDGGISNDATAKKKKIPIDFAIDRYIQSTK